MNFSSLSLSLCEFQFHKVKFLVSFSRHSKAKVFERPTRKALFDSRTKNFSRSRAGIRWRSRKRSSAGLRFSDRLIVRSGSRQIVSRGLAGTAVLHDLEVHLLAIVERAEARALDGGDVDEDVRSAGVRSDEAVALGGVEPLDGT